MSAAAPLPHPGVRFPPPLLYLAGFVVGWLLHRAWPLPISALPTAARGGLAALLAVVWLALTLGAFVTFRRARTTIIPNRAAAALVTGGPFRFTRNPMYLGFVALYVALALLLDSWWPLALLPLVVLVLQRAVIAREERYLAGAFPLEYPAYCRRVSRWL